MGLMISSIARIGNGIFPKNLFGLNSDYYLYILDYSNFDFQESHNYSSELHSSEMSRILNNYQYNFNNSNVAKLESYTFHSDKIMSWRKVFDIENIDYDEVNPAKISPAFLFTTIQPNDLNKISVNNVCDNEFIFLRIKLQDRDANRIPQLVNEMFSNTGLAISRCRRSGIVSSYENVYVFDYCPETQTATTSKASAKKPNIQGLKKQVLTQSNRKIWIKRVDKKWLFAGVVIPIAIALVTLFFGNSNKSQSFEGSTNIGNNILGDNATINNTQEVNTYLNQPIVGNDYGEKSRFKIAGEVNLNTPISYIKQHLGNPHIFYADRNIKGVKSMVYDYDEFCMKIETIDGEVIRNLSFLLCDTTINVNINKTPITLGRTTFGDICTPNTKLERWISASKGGGVETKQYMANPGNYWHCNIGIYSYIKTENLGKLLFIEFKENEDFTINLEYYKNVKINFASIAREENELGEFNYDDFK